MSTERPLYVTCFFFATFLQATKYQDDDSRDSINDGACWTIISTGELLRVTITHCLYCTQAVLYTLPVHTAGTHCRYTVHTYTPIVFSHQVDSNRRPRGAENAMANVD